MEQKKLKWKDVYNENKQRRYSEIAGIKEENVEIESNSFRVLKDRKYIILVAAIIFSAFLIWSFRKDIKLLLFVLGFFAVAGICFFVFNYFKFRCQKDGLYIRFGVQEALFKYDRIKNVYLSRFNDSSYLFSIRTYNIVILYEDNLNRLRELYFDVTFTDKQQLVEFLDNFNVKEIESTQYNNFERFKLLKKIGKILMIVAFIVIVGMYAYIRIHG